MEIATTTKKDPKQYPILRNLQFSPIKEGEDQFIVLWDPTGLSQEKLVLPLNYFFIVQHFDGEHSLQEIGAIYLKRFGEFLMPHKVEHLVSELDDKLFLEGTRSDAARQQALDVYRGSEVRKAAFSGRSYEADPAKLRSQLEGFFKSKEGPEPKASEHRGKPIKGLVAPTYELKHAGPVYAWAYKELEEAQQPDLYIVIGTAYSGLSRLFAVTDKNFETPLGVVPVEPRITDHLRAAVPTCFEEELAHRHEQAIEFQLPFLQHVVGTRKNLAIVPILSSFSASSLGDAGVRRDIEAFVQALREALARVARPYCVVAGAELAHVGMRYGDAAPPTDFSFHRCMQQDLAMLKHVEERQPEEFALFIQRENDQRRIAGFSPIYTLLRLIEAETGQVLRYDRGITDQYNSTVTYASIAFF
ncbi:MAG TPA: AmmeMemoRadiSam system protein B [Nitrospiraceae bacterium]|nr:AmmeMemoRadiSam system protein B [Nitrospiraceae bacterium]